MLQMNRVGLAIVSIVVLTCGAFSQAPSGSGLISTVAGTGAPGFSGDGGPATAAQLQGPGSIGMDAAGNLFIADSKNERVRKVASDGTIASVNVGAVGASDMFILDAAGAMYMTSVTKHSVRKVTPGGESVTIAGNGSAGFGGDNGPASAAQLNTPFGLAVDAAGNLFIADTLNHRIRKVTPDGKISTIAGTGKPGFQGDGKKAIEAQFNFPTSLAIDPSGNLYVSDQGNNRVRKITSAGVVSTAVGSAKGGFGGDGGKATSSQLNGPGPLAFDREGNLYVVDQLNHRIRKVNAAGVITTVAGNGDSGSAGDGGPAVAAQLTIPTGLAAGPVGNLFIADADRVRKITFNK